MDSEVVQYCTLSQSTGRKNEDGCGACDPARRRRQRSCRSGKPNGNQDMETATAVTHLECSRTGERFEAGKIHNLSTAGWPLLVRYDIETLKKRWTRDSLASAPRSMWRYAPLLPVRFTKNIVS